MAITRVPVVGSWYGPDDQPASGHVIIELVTPMQEPGNRFVSNRRVNVPLVNGALPAGFTLDATDDPSVQPAGVYYRVTAQLDGARMPPLLVNVPHTSSEVDLTTVAPAAGTDPIFNFALQATLDAHLADATDAHGASAISVAPIIGIAATDVQAALAEIAGDDMGASAAIAAETARATSAEATKADQTALDAEAIARADADALLIPLTEKGTANGVADLDADALLRDAVIPPGIARDSETTAAIAAEAAARTAAIDAAVANLISGAPGALDTLNELATALGDDPNFATTLTNALAGKVDKSLFDANTVLAATADNTPVALTVAASTILGRKATGGIVAMTVGELKTLLALAAVDISDFNTAVRTNQLDQMAAPTAAVPFNAQRITGLGDPTAAQDALTRAAGDTRYAPLQDSEPFNGPLWDGIYNGVTFRNSIITIRFDDGPTADYATVFPLLTARKLVGGFALNSAKLGDGTHITAAQALEMQQAGMEIMCHSKTHGADPADFATFLTEAITNKADLEALTGLLIQSFVQPGTWTTDYNFNTNAKVESTQGRYLRRYYAAMFGYVPEAQFDSNYKLAGGRKYGAIHFSPGSSLATAEASIDNAVNAGGLLDILIHSLSLDTAGNLSTADFTSLLDYIQAKRDAGLCDVLTPTGGVYAKQANPRVNIAPNPTFDVGTFSAWGQTGSPILVVGGGRTPGHNAARINSTNYLSRAWRATEMRSVLIEVWVKNAVAAANSTANLQTYSRDPDGATQYGLRQTGNVATTDTWQKLQLVMGVDSRAQDFVVKMTSGNAAGANDVLFSEIAIYKLG